MSLNALTTENYTDTSTEFVVDALRVTILVIVTITE
jgi:hypothetical protein